jgi:hypothetical protein
MTREHYGFVVRTAFKEWAIVVDALGRGEQILILRKGGINEGRGGFQVEHSKFFLFPTMFHQQRQSVVPHAQARFDSIAPQFARPDQLRIEFFAEVVDWRRMNALVDAEELRGQHVWRDEVIAERFEWGKVKNIFAMAARVFRLAHPVELPMCPSYGGCKSWVDLEQDIDIARAKPVLDEHQFALKLQQFTAALQPAYK